VSAFGLCYAAMAAVLGFFIGYFWLVARALS